MNIVAPVFSLNFLHIASATELVMQLVKAKTHFSNGSTNTQNI